MDGNPGAVKPRQLLSLSDGIVLICPVSVTMAGLASRGSARVGSVTVNSSFPPLMASMAPFSARTPALTGPQTAGVVSVAATLPIGPSIMASRVTPMPHKPGPSRVRECSGG